MGVALGAVFALAAPRPTQAQSLAEQWKTGLGGARLTAYSGSVTSDNSSLYVIEFCRDGRYRYSQEGSWSVPGTAGGASNSAITGRWDIIEQGGGVVVTYITDQGEQGSFPIYLQNDGRVNVGGLAYSAEPGAAGC